MENSTPKHLDQQTQNRPQQSKDEAPSMVSPPRNNPPKYNPQAENNQNQPVKQKAGFLKSIPGLLLAATFGFLGGWAGNYTHKTSVDQVTTQKIQKEIVTVEANLINKIAKDVSKSVVSIDASGFSYSDSFFNDTAPTSEILASGTGFVIDDSGLILTNRHVVPKGITKVEVIFEDGTKAPAKVVGRTNLNDPLDIAFLKVKNPEKYQFHPVQLGNSDDLEVGDKVVAIGNALGEFQNTVTSGIISGFGRDIKARISDSAVESLQNLIQTDAAINSGNSGGPLVDSDGRVIGVNVAKVEADNISFAIPINDIKGLISIVVETGQFKRPFLGIRYISVNEAVAKELDLPVDYGVYIIPSRAGQQSSIAEDSAAEKAGLQEGDIILAINGQKIDKKQTLHKLITAYRAGDTITLDINRDGQQKQISLTLGVAPDN